MHRPLARKLAGLLVALAPVLVAVAALARVCASTRGESAIVDESLPTPRGSSGLRPIDVLRPAPPWARILEVRVRLPDPEAMGARGDDRLAIQMSTAGRALPLVVDHDGGDGSRLRALGRVLAGRARLAVARDGEWIELGELATLAAGDTKRLRLIGLLPWEMTAMAAIDAEPSAPGAPGLMVSAPAPEASGDARPPRHRVLRHVSAPRQEPWRRLLFLPGESPVIAGLLAAACALLALGWRNLLGERDLRAAAQLVAGAALLHAALLPPLQAADETSFAGTIDAVGAAAAGAGDTPPFPGTVAALARALDQDRVQHHPDEPLPLRGEAERGRLRERLRAAEGGAAVGDAAPPGAAMQSPELRAPGYFRMVAPLALLARSLGTLDRIMLYRAASTLSGALLLGLALLALDRGLRGEPFRGYASLALGLVGVLPYTVFVLGSTSNYATAIGLGACLAATATIAACASTRRRQLLAAASTAALGLVGGTVWPDFFAVGFAAAAILAALLLRGPMAESEDPARLARARLALGAGVLAIVAWAGTVVRERLAAGAGPASSLWRELWLQPGRFAGLALAVAIAGIGVGVSLVAVARARAWPAERIRRRACQASAAALLAMLVAWVALPFSVIPYEDRWLDLPSLAVAHARAFASSALSFDQDRLGWKLVVGAGGWHDLFLHDALYAATKWLLVAGLVLLPWSTAPFRIARPRAAALLLFVAWASLAAIVGSAVLRHGSGTHPHGRFALPLLPLLLVPALLRSFVPGRERVLRVAIGCFTLVAIDVSLAGAGRRWLGGVSYASGATRGEVLAERAAERPQPGESPPRPGGADGTMQEPGPGAACEAGAACGLESGEARFADQRDGTILDRTTGLLWEKKDDAGGLHDKDARWTWTSGAESVWRWLDWLNRERFAGHDDWRLPAVEELASLVRFDRWQPAIDAVFENGCVPGCSVVECSCTAAGVYWSATATAAPRHSAWGIDFLTGTSSFYSDGVYEHVRAVCSAPAPRATPTVAPAATPTPTAAPTRTARPGPAPPRGRTRAR